MMEENILYKSLTHEVKDLDEAKGIVTIYINAFNNEDSDGDISAPGSFKRTFKNQFKIIKHLLNHNGNYLLGLPLDLKEDDHGAIAVSQMNMKKQIVKDVFEDYRLFAANKRSLDHSIRVRDIKRDTDDERIVLEWKLWEYSTLYTWGANPETPMVEIKNMKDLEIMLREGNYSDEKAKKIEQLYNQLKNHLDDPSNTPRNPSSTPEDSLDTSKDPLTLDKENQLIKHFYKQLKL